jgi:hypothetical protein
VIVVDTGPLVAAAIADDRYNAACVALFIRMHQQHRELLVPGLSAFTLLPG